uniref:Uncharacterized protein n=1 Tax=Aegilops tauschii subsp. strangulata TaxID=200361 RepID=A0A453KKY1_AEGTS
LLLISFIASTMSLVITSRSTTWYVASRFSSHCFPTALSLVRPECLHGEVLQP